MSEFDSFLNSVEWQAAEPNLIGDTEEGMPYATHFGVFKIGDIDMRVYRLNTGQAIINAEDFERFFLSAFDGNGLSKAELRADGERDHAATCKAPFGKCTCSAGDNF